MKALRRSGDKKGMQHFRKERAGERKPEREDKRKNERKNERNIERKTTRRHKHSEQEKKVVGPKKQK